jgi:von Willebrand factor type A domain
LSRSSLLLSILCCACGPTTHGGANTDANGGDGNQVDPADAASCASATVMATKSPLDLYIMLDQSGSMSQTVSGGGTKWAAVTSALSSFLTQSGLTGISIGLQYFGLNNDSCTASNYATPAVEIAAMPGASTALVNSIAAHSPTSGTPTSAALQGAIDHATTWSTAHAGDIAAVVFATDGDPEECDTNLTDIDAIAAAGYAANPKVATFVIGVGSSLSNLNGIAAAGGTTSAFIVDTNSNVNAQFLAAMNAIRDTASCTYQIPIPASGTPDFSQVNVVYTPAGGTATTIPNVQDKAACPATGNGWYYDDPTHPTAILLCTSTCGTVQASGSVNIALGCNTIVL